MPSHDAAPPNEAVSVGSVCVVDAIVDSMLSDVPLMAGEDYVEAQTQDGIFAVVS